MENGSKFKQQLIDNLRDFSSKGFLEPKYVPITLQFFDTYALAALESGLSWEAIFKILTTFLKILKERPKDFVFEPFHQSLRAPFDYFQFGLDFIKPLISKNSVLKGYKNLDRLTEQLKLGENVVLLANHQTEPDPQAISILLQERYPDLSQEMIFVAGERVITDPLAIPFSMGCNLLCIYSKRYIDYPPEQKLKKQLHNKKTMQKMSELFNEGGKCIYVAVSGGRDRKNAAGNIEVAPFDPQSLEMFYLMSKRAKRKTHFYPLTLNTYEILPPPDSIQTELGESRLAYHASISISFGEEIDMENISLSGQTDKHTLRKHRAEAIWKLVQTEFEVLRS